MEQGGISTMDARGGHRNYAEGKFHGVEICRGRGDTRKWSSTRLLLENS